MQRTLFHVLISGVLSLGFLLGPTSASSTAQAQPQSPIVPGEVLVKFRPGTPGQAVASAHRAEQAQVRATIPRIDVQVVQVAPGREIAAAAAYERNPNVQFAEVNRLYEAITHGTAYPQDPRFDEQWQYHNTGQSGGKADADIDAYEAWNTVKGSSEINIAILDTGIDDSHEDLSVAQKKNFTDSSTLTDRYGHGTHVAGSAAARTNNGKGVAGTCPSCALWNYKVLNDRGSGQWDWIATGITTAATDGAHVINLSLGGYSPSQTLELAVNKAWSLGAVLVGAAGNDGENWGLYPAAYENVIAVGATDHNDLRASFSNWGANWVDVAAPGASILSTAPKSRTTIWRGGTNGYGTISGTSMATPHVAGVAGLVWSSELCSDNSCVRTRIESTADDTAGTGTDFTIHGRVNAAASVGGTSVSPSPSNPVPDTTITSHPPNLSNSSSASFSFESNVSGSTFECRLDGGGYSTCTSPKDYTGLSEGSHSFEVRATSSGGTDSTPASYSWTVSTSSSPAPAVEVDGISPSSMKAGTSVTVTITGNGFQTGATVIFQNGSGNTPTASSVTVSSDAEITATVQVGGGGPPRDRVWDVRVTNPDGSSAVKSGAFTVNP